MEIIEGLFLEKVKDWLELVKNKNCNKFSEKMKELKKQLMEFDPKYERAYTDMYSLLDDS
jgi:hypothetical protein